MRLATFRYRESDGWSQPLPSEMDSEHTLVMAFSDPRFLSLPTPLLELGSAFPKSTVIGCSTAGEILGSSIYDDTVSVAVARFESTRLRLASVPIALSADSYSAGERIGKHLAGADLKGVLVLSDGLLVNGSELLRGMGSALPPSVVIGGGLAGDGPRFKKTWVIHEKRPCAGFISAVGLYGPKIAISAGSLGGWDVFGPERLVTKSAGNVLFELDGKPALTLYKKYLGDRATELPASALLFPLSLRSKVLDRKGLVRTVLAVNESDNSMTFAGDVPEGSYAQLMKANFDRLIEGAAGAARLVARNAPSSGESLAIAISCVGRRLVLGARTESETEATLEILPLGTRQVGFYSYGEISPLTSGKCDLHNQTMTLTLISEV